MLPEQDTFLSQLYHENFNRLLGNAFHHTADWAKAEVVVQEAFCVATEKIDEIMTSDSPLRWMKAVIKNVARNTKKHESYQKAMFLYLEDLMVTPAIPDSSSDVDILEVCEQIVGKERFQLFKRTVLDGTPYIEAAKELGISVWACRKRVQRISDALREGLKEFFNDLSKKPILST